MANLDPGLLEIIVCPACHGELLLVDGAAGADSDKGTDEDTAELVCQSCGLAYPVRHDIPVLLVDEARRPS